MEVADLIQKIRFTLGDEAKDRWSDERILDLVDEAQKDICLHTNMLKSDSYVPLVQGTYTYKLPEDAIITHRIQTLDCKLPFKTREDMDGKNCMWRTIEGPDVQAIIKDSLPTGKFEVYPIPNDEMFYIPTYQGVELEGDTMVEILDAEGVVSNFYDRDGDHNMIDLLGVYTSSSLSVEITIQDPTLPISPWGVLVDYYTLPSGDLSYINRDWAIPDEGVLADVGPVTPSKVTDITVWGVMVEIDEAYGWIDSQWGCVTNIIYGSSVMKVLYTAEPQSLLTLQSQFTIGSIWLNAMKYYACGYALMDDNDAGNMARGKEFLTRYSRELERAKKLVAVESHSDSSARLTQYQSGFRR